MVFGVKWILVGVLFFNVLAFAALQKRNLVVFDLDHTLVDSNWRNCAILQQVGREFGDEKLANIDYESSCNLRSLRKAGKSHLTTPEMYKRFNQIFFYDSSLTELDTLMPGGPEFVEHMMNELDADILYLTGRGEQEFLYATVNQLNRFNYPGYGAKAHLHGRTALMLKPSSPDVKTEPFKLEYLQSLQNWYNVVAVFDDSSANVNLFRKGLHPLTVIVRPTRNVLDYSGLEKGIVQLTDYTQDRHVSEAGEVIYVDNFPKIEAIVRMSKACAFHLNSKKI